MEKFIKETGFTSVAGRCAIWEKPERSRKIQDIERLRGLAVLFVLMAHFSLTSAVFLLAGLKPHKMPFGLGVELFFVISGYVVTQSFLNKRLSFRVFYLRRVFRLWPVVFVLFALTAGVNYMIHRAIPDRTTFAHAAWSDVLHQAPSVLFGYRTIQQMYDGTGPIWCNAPMWSLSIEEQFYLIAPVTLALLGLIFRNHTRACRWFTLGLYLFLAVSARFGMAFGEQLGMPSLTHPPGWLKYVVFYRFDFIALGVLLYFLRDFTAPLHRLPRLARQALMVLCLVAPLVASYKLSNGPANYPNFPQDAPWLHSFGLLGIGLAFGMALVLASADDDLLAISSPVNGLLLYLGARSYSIYVLHFSILLVTWLPIYLYAEWLFYKPPFYYGVHHLFTTLVVLVPFIEIVHRCVELPFIRLGARLVAGLDRRREVIPSQPAVATEVRMAA